jgi:hypothetical protein
VHDDCSLLLSGGIAKAALGMQHPPLVRTEPVHLAEDFPLTRQADVALRRRVHLRKVQGEAAHKTAVGAIQLDR